MATVAQRGVHAGPPVRVVRTTTDRESLRAFLERDRIFAAYALCDLDDREFSRTRWGVSIVDGSIEAVVLEYAGYSPQPLFVMGANSGIAAVLRDVVRPRVAYVAALPANLPAVEEHYRVDAGPEMVRMWVDRSAFRPVGPPVGAELVRLVPVDAGELNRLYQLGFTAWLPATAVAEGTYFGIRSNGRLVAAAGTHVISSTARLGVVGNVMTHASFRGRGFAQATTSAVTAELLRACEQVVLNVRADNPPAIAAYRHLGYREHVRFDERLVHRTSPAGSLLAARVPVGIRRLFTFRREMPP